MANSCHRVDEDKREPAPATQHGSNSAACNEDTLKVFWFLVLRSELGVAEPGASARSPREG